MCIQLYNVVVSSIKYIWDPVYVKTSGAAKAEKAVAKGELCAAFSHSLGFYQSVGRSQVVHIRYKKSSARVTSLLAFRSTRVR